MKRKVPFVNNEYYHVFNRGVEKRTIFKAKYDYERFIKGMKAFNVIEPIGSIHENTYRGTPLGGPASKLPASEKLVNIVCYCLNPNHYHFILEQLVDRGVEKFMHRLGTGYAYYFNKKYKRSGGLFQGRFKSQHINSNGYLLHASVYVNLNNQVHQYSDRDFRSSWKEYLDQEKGFCCKDSVIKQFDNVLEYKKFTENQLEYIKENKASQRMQMWSDDSLGS